MLDATAETVLKNHAPSVKARAAIEVEIVRAVMAQALREGFILTLEDQDDYGTQYRYGDPAHSMTELDFLREVFACDDARVRYEKANDPRSDSLVYFVFGNDGWDVISDYHCDLESVLSDAQKISDKFG